MISLYLGCVITTWVIIKILKIKPLGVYRNMGRFILEINPKGLVRQPTYTMLVQHFVEPDLRIENTLEKKRQENKIDVDLEIAD